jgi:hypothetical protein
MNRMIAFAALTLAFGIAVPGIAAAQTAKDLVGTWTEVSNVNIHQDGSRADTFPAGSKGVFIFDGNGHYASVTLTSSLPKFASGNRNTGTPEENKAIVQGSLAHYGTYAVADKVITLKVEGSTWPAWTGTDQKRTIISFTGDEVKWSLAASIGGTSEVAWKRVK